MALHVPCSNTVGDGSLPHLDGGDAVPAPAIISGDRDAQHAAAPAAPRQRRPRLLAVVVEHQQRAGLLDTPLSQYQHVVA